MFSWNRSLGGRKLRSATVVFVENRHVEAVQVLSYLRARYHNPTTGRFMSRDPNDPNVRDEIEKPIDPTTLHKYLYAGGDPANMIDPTGRDIIEGTLVLESKSLSAVTVSFEALRIQPSSGD